MPDGACQEEDCERPPAIENGDATLSVDGDEDVTARYSCHDGYRLIGDEEIFCNLDTETWAKVPKCQKGNDRESLLTYYISIRMDGQCISSDIISLGLSYRHLHIIY